MDLSLFSPQYLPYYLIGVNVFNFKSYKGKHCIGPFTEVTAIIGPNGSGKSNLMDAISFALLTKYDKLRLKNLSMLTDSFDDNFQGDSFDESGSLVYVELVFASKIFSEHTISFKRTINQKKISKYFVNDIAISNTEYVDYLSKIGFNCKKSMFLIFQNTIEKLMLNDPKYFTYIIEEISGSVVYKNEYDELKNICTEKENRLHTLNKEKQNFFQTKKFMDNISTGLEQNKALLSEIDQIKQHQVLADLYFNGLRIESTKVTLNEKHQLIKEINNEILVKQDEKNTIHNLLVEKRIENNKIGDKNRQFELNFLLKTKHQYEVSCAEFESTENHLKNANKNKNRILFEMNNCEDIVNALNNEIDILGNEIDFIRQNITFDDELRNEYHRLKNLYLSILSENDQTNGQHEMKLSDLKQKRFHLERNREKLQKQLVKYKNSFGELEKIKEDIEKCTKEKDELENEKNAIIFHIENINGKLKEVSEKLETFRASSADKLINKIISEKAEKRRQFVSYLKQHYPNVHGRLCDLCQPTNKKYQVAISIIMKKYLYAIVVDSFKTVKQILKNEMLENSEIFLALDTIKPTTIQDHLRHSITIPNIHLIYDLIVYQAKFEPVIRFVVGNTLIADTCTDAANAAYNLGDGSRRYNVISINGTLFSAQGRVSASFSAKPNIPWNERQQEDNLEIESTQKEYLDLKNKKNILMQENNNLDAEILEKIIILENLESNNSSEELNLKKLIEEKETELKQIQTELDEVNSEFFNCSETFDNYQAYLRTTEQSVFGEFLSQVNFSNLKEFENVYYDKFDDKRLKECEEHYRNLQMKLKAEKNKNFKHELKKWEDIIKKDSEKLIELKKTIDACQENINNEEQNLENMKQTLENENENLKKLNSEFKQVQTDLKNLKSQLVSANKLIIKLNFDLKSFKKDRFEYFKRSINEGIPLPVDPDILSNISLNSSTWEDSDDIEIDFEMFPDIKAKTEDEYTEIKLKLAQELMKKEEEIQQMTISSIPDLTSKKKELAGKLANINKNINTARIELDKYNRKFQNVKSKRCQKFNEFFEKLSDNLNKFYKELMRDNSSQSYLIPENCEEPYLNGVLFNCIVPGKTFQPVNGLSGGEKTLATFAFIFSLFYNQMPPFFIMDEIDGALDNINTAKLVKFLKTKSTSTQFIMISLKPEMFGQMDSLIGICKEKTNESKTLSLDLRGYLD